MSCSAYLVSEAYSEVKEEQALIKKHCLLWALKNKKNRSRQMQRDY